MWRLHLIWLVKLDCLRFTVNASRASFTPYTHPDSRWKPLLPLVSLASKVKICLLSYGCNAHSSPNVWCQQSKSSTRTMQSRTANEGKNTKLEYLQWQKKKKINDLTNTTANNVTFFSTCSGGTSYVCISIHLLSLLILECGASRAYHLPWGQQVTSLSQGHI